MRFELLIKKYFRITFNSRVFYVFARRRFLAHDSYLDVQYHDVIAHEMQRQDKSVIYNFAIKPEAKKSYS